MLDKQKLNDKMYLDIAKVIAERSYAERSKVGAVLVKNTNILSYGFNGTPHGFNNLCEYTDFHVIGGVGSTKPEVLHAESNAIAKVATSTQSSKDSTLYVTLSPCFDCAKLIIQAGIKRVVYSEAYRTKNGIELLKEAGVLVEELK